MDIEDIINNKKELFSNIDLKKLKSYIYDIIQLNPQTIKEFNDSRIIARRKNKICPRKAQIIHYYRKLVENGEVVYNSQLENLMIKKSIRGSSGIVSITVVTSPNPSWDEEGERKTQKFSCGKDCGYCPNEPRVDLTCKIINIDIGVKSSIISLKSKEDIDEVRVITYLTLYDGTKINIWKQKNFNDNTKTFDIIILNKYTNNIKIGDNCKATKIEQPRSYVSTGPSLMRANRNNFDAISQFYDRATSLEMCGHIIDKVELLVLGGTWSHYPVKYQEEFIRDIYYAANTYYTDIKREKYSLHQEMQINQRARCRIIGLTLETRPDCINKREIIRLRSYGCTRVQIGVQHINDDILKGEGVTRGCFLRHIIKALFILKRNGFKADIHIMTDLPGSNYDIDKEMFDKILGINNIIKVGNMKIYYLTSPDLQADQWKIYPTEVTRWTKIYDMYHEGTYKPYSEDICPVTGNKKIIDLLIHIKQKVFPWIRLNRVIRDIPENEIFGGIRSSNLRQDIHKMMKAQGKKCDCIRCREIRGRKIDLNDVKLIVRRYNDINAYEYFISFESKDESIIYGFCRLRLNESNDNIFFDVLRDSAIIRELHVYGMMVPHNDNNKKTQHRGFGKRLIQKAEQLALENGFQKMAIISGVGVREYYENRGYELEDTYMVKRLIRSGTGLFSLWDPTLVIHIIIIVFICVYIGVIELYLF